MNSFYKLTAEQQSAIIQNVASKMGLSAAAVEKDIWVTCILQMLFCSDIWGRLSSKAARR